MDRRLHRQGNVHHAKETANKAALLSSLLRLNHGKPRPPSDRLAHATNLPAAGDADHGEWLRSRCLVVGKNRIHFDLLG